MYGGALGHMVFQSSFVFFLPSTIAYPAPPSHPSCVFWVALVIIVSSLSFLTAIFIAPLCCNTSDLWC